MIFATVCLSWLISRQPPYGNSMLLWSVTGVGPVYLFVKIAKRVTAQRNNGAVPLYSDMDFCLVNGFLEFLFVSGAMTILMTVLYRTQTTEALPSNLGQAVAAWLVTAGFGFGFGLISRLLWRTTDLWRMMFPAITRGLLHLSGVYFVVDYLPPAIRYYLSFNPVIDAVTMFRLGFFPTFPSYVFSLRYLLWIISISLFIGIVLEGLFGDRIVKR